MKFVEAPSSGAAQNFARSSQWIFAGTVLTRPIQLITNVIFARLLGPDNYGLMGLGTSLAVTFGLLASFGLGDAMTKFVAEHYRRDTNRALGYVSLIFWGGFAISLFVLGTLWLTQDRWRALVFPAQVTPLMIFLCLCLAFMNLIFALLIGVLAGLQLFREVAIFNLLQAVAVAALAMVLGFYSIQGALVAYVLGCGVCVCWGIFKIWQFDYRLFRLPSLNNLAALRSILMLSLPLWIAYFFMTPVWTYTFAYLARQREGARELGMFSTALGLRTIVTILPGVVGLVISPAVIQEAGMHGDKTAYDSLLKKSFLSLVFLTLPLLILFLFFGDFLFLIYGRAFGSAFRLFAPLCGSAAIGAIAAPLVPAMTGRNKVWWSLGFGVFKSVVLVALTVWWVPAHLSMGLAWAFCVSETGYYLLATEFCIGVSVLPKSIRRVFYPALLGILATIVVAIALPDLGRWVLGLPISLAVAVSLMRGYPPLVAWLGDSIPHPIRPGAQAVLSFITS